MDNSLLIKNVLLDGEKKTLLCRDGRFVSLDAAPGAEAARVIDAEGLAILPAFYNTHTHAAMTLMRGYGDDRPLHEWLEQWVWPYEDSLGAKDIRRGSEIAIREMISTGTVFFNDMYFFIDETIDLVKASGMRAAIGVTLMDNHPKALRDEKSALVRAWKDSERLLLTVAPHSVYTASKDTLQEAAKLARENGRKIHIHISETAKEVKECLAKTGMTPVRYLDSLELLGPDVIAAHCVHVDKEEWDILAERGVTVSHCPCSNMKLGSGRFPYELAIASGARITLGTDGCSSNNHLDMREEMKHAIEQGQNFSAKYADNISIVMSVRQALYFLPEAIRIFEKEQPGVQITPMFNYVHGLEVFLKNEADIFFALTEQTKHIPGITVHKLFDSRIYLIADINDPLAAKNTISEEDIYGRTLMVGGGSPEALRSVQQRLISSGKISYFNSPDHDSTLTNVAAGKGICLAPGFLNDHSGQFAWIPFDCEECFHLVLCTHKTDNRKSLNTFIKTLQKLYTDAVAFPL